MVVIRSLCEFINNFVHVSDSRGGTFKAGTLVGGGIPKLP